MSEPPVVQGDAVQCVTGVVGTGPGGGGPILTYGGGGIGGKGGGGGGNWNPNLPRHGTWHLVNRLKTHLIASVTTSNRFPQVSVHRRPTHFQSQWGISTQPPSMELVLYLTVAV